MISDLQHASLMRRRKKKKAGRGDWLLDICLKNVCVSVCEQEKEFELRRGEARGMPYLAHCKHLEH